MDLQELRSEIDSIDDQLIKLFCQRMQVSSKIAAYKEAYGLPIYVPSREAEKLRDVSLKAGTEMESYARTLYSTLFELSRSYQKDVSLAINKPQEQITNIALIGMPGCGKSTIGSMLAARLGKQILDTDDWICKSTGKSIPEIFNQHGENHFRDLETQALTLCCKSEGSIIATGGGCVTRQRNYWLLKQNCLIIWLQRDLDKLPTLGRPLSENTNLYDLFNQRKPLYKDFSDIVIDNNGTPDETVCSILKSVEKNL